MTDYRHYGSRRSRSTASSFQCAGRGEILETILRQVFQPTPVPSGLRKSRAVTGTVGRRRLACYSPFPRAQKQERNRSAGAFFRLSGAMKKPPPRGGPDPELEASRSPL